MKLVGPIDVPEFSRLYIEPRVMLFLALCLSVVLPAPAFSAAAAAMLIWCIPLSSMQAGSLAFKIAAPFLTLGVFGLLMASGNSPVDVWRDAWYVAKLGVCLALGMMLGLRQSSPAGIHRVLILFAVFSALYPFVVWVGDERIPAFLTDSREFGLSLASLAALPVLADRILERQGPVRWFYTACVLLMLAAAVLSDSRITLISIALMGVAWAGMFVTWQKTTKAAIALALIGAVIWQFLPEYNGGDLNALTKLRRSFEEISFTDAYDPTAMIYNWRGFEAYNAQLMFEAANFWQKIFGSGLGAQVDLGLSVRMSEEMEYRFLPTIHNGFYYILIKFGIIGLIVYGTSIIQWSRWGRSNFDASNLEDRILRGLIAIVLMSTAVITGLYNKEELNGASILIAFLIGFQYRRHHELVYWLRYRSAGAFSRSSPQVSAAS